MSDQYDRLQPPFIISSIRSMPRRWKEALHVHPPKNIDDFYSEPGPTGESAASDVGAALEQVRVLADAIRTTSYNVPEALGGEVETAMKDAGTGPWPPTAGEALHDMERLMEDLGDRLESLQPHDWAKRASTPSGSDVSVEQLGQATTRVLATRLARVAQTIRQVS
jgi:hypothetical protein